MSIGLINDSTITSTVRAFRTRTVQPPANCGSVVPTISAARTATGLKIEFTGTLQQSSTVDGEYTDVVATSPHTVPTNETMRFYRAKN